MKEKVLKPIYTAYSTTNCTDRPFLFCTLKDLTYAQWIDQSILKNAPKYLGIRTNESYTRAFPNFTTLIYTPELSYFFNKAELKPLYASS